MRLIALVKGERMDGSGQPWTKEGLLECLVLLDLERHGPAHPWLIRRRLIKLLPPEIGFSQIATPMIYGVKDKLVQKGSIVEIGRGISRNRLPQVTYQITEAGRQQLAAFRQRLKKLSKLFGS